jgi:crotonobetainyl-CoA:carnitine CoA-transferase CaiB-like acyl-CoA transferase
MLDGVRIVDLTQIMAGPFATMLLADLGADVIKVESPSGDQTRRGAGHALKGEDTVGFLALNRNKRSVSIDLSSLAGRAVFHDLVRTADIVIENFRPGVTGRLGIDSASLAEIRPDLIYASISGFGQDGPYADRPGFDLIAQAMSGIMSVTGEPGGRPAKCGLPISDLAAGLFCATAVLAAYIERMRTGRGQLIDTSLYEAALALSVWESTEFWGSGRLPGPLGSAHRMNAPYQALRTADGHIVVGANNERLWTRLCEAIERPDLLADERFGSNVERLAHVTELEAELEKTFVTASTDEWVERLLAAGTPAGPIRNYAEALADQHTLARGMIQQIEHPVEGVVNALAMPIAPARHQSGPARPAPILGEHTVEVLRELGYDDESVDALTAQRAVVTR